MCLCNSYTKIKLYNKKDLDVLTDFVCMWRLNTAKPLSYFFRAFSLEFEAIGKCRDIILGIGSSISDCNYFVHQFSL